MKDFTDKQIKNMKLFFTIINSAYKIIDVFGEMKDNKNWQDTKDVVNNILEILEHPKPCIESLELYLERLEVLLRIEGLSK